MWIHPIATSLKERNPIRSAALRAAARLCETMARTSSCRQTKNAILAIPAPDDVDPIEWSRSLGGAMVGINLHAIRLGLDPYRDPSPAE